MTTFTTDQLNRKTITTAELDQRESYEKVISNIDPEVTAKKNTGYILSKELGVDIDTVNSTYNSVIKSVYGEQLRPSQVQKRMEDDGLLASPKADDSDTRSFAHAVMTNTEPPIDVVERRQRKNLVRQTSGMFGSLRSMEENLFTANTEWANGVKNKIDDPNTIYALPDYDDADLLDIGAYMGLLEQTTSKQQVEELRSERQALIGSLYFDAVKQQQQALIAKEMSKFTTGTKAQDVTLEAAKGLYSALNTVARGVWSTSVAMGIEENQPNVDEVERALSSANMTRNEAAGKIGYVTRAMSEAIPSFLYNMTVGRVGIFTVEYGNSYQDVINNGGTEIEANAVALPVATINTIIESMQIDRIMKFAGRGKGAKQALKKLVKDRAYKAFLKSGAKFTGQSVKIAINEGIEGALQQGVTIAVPGVITGVYPKNEDGSIDWVEVGSQMGQSFVGEGLGGLFLGSMGGIHNARNSHNYKLTIAGQLMTHEGLPENQALPTATRILERLIAQDGSPKEIYREELGKVKLADNRHKASAHIIQKAKGIPEEQYRQIAEDTTGKRSIKEMNYEEAEIFIDALRNTEAVTVEKTEKTTTEIQRELETIRDEPEVTPEAAAAPSVDILETTPVKVSTKIKKEITKEVRADEVFQIEAEALGVQTRQVDVGVFYVPETFKGEVKTAIEDNPSLKFNITHDPTKGIPFDTAVQEGFLQAEGVTGELDISEFLERVSAAKKAQKKVGGISEVILNKMIDSGNPFSEITALKHIMSREGFSIDEINDSIVDIATDPEYDIDPTPLLLRGKADVEAKQRIPEEVESRQEEEERPKVERGGFLDNSPFGNEDLLADSIEEILVDEVKPKSTKTLKALKATKSTERLKSAGVATVKGLDRLFGLMSTRIKNISPAIFQDIRNKVINPTLLLTAERTEQVRPFIDGINRKLNDEDRHDFEVAQWQGDEVEVNKIVKRNSLTREYEQYRKTQDLIYHEGNAVGMNIDYLTAYFPSVVKDFDGLMKELNRREEYAPIILAVKDAESKKGRPLTKDEKSRLVNSLLRGFQVSGLTLSKPGFAKERTLIRDDIKLIKYYYGFEESTSRYIESMTESVQERKFFGRTTKELVDLRANISRTKTSIAKFKKKFAKRTITQRKAERRLSRMESKLEVLDDDILDNSIGNHVADLVDNRTITYEQQEELRQVFEGLFKTTPSSKGIKTLRSLEYVGSLAQIPAIITQYSEVVLSLLKAPGSTLPAFVKANLQKSKIKLSDIGVAHIGQEWVDADLDKTVTALLKPFELADRVGKETFVNSTVEKYQKMAKTNPDKARKEIAKYYPEAGIESVLESLASGVIDNNVKGFALNELADVQPISKFEVPEIYAKAGNLKVFYMYKTFVLKRLDIIRNQAYNEIKAGVKAGSNRQIMKGIAKLLWLAIMFTLADSTADVVKDVVRGKPIDTIDNYIVDNLLQMILLSKYSVNKSKTEGLGSFFKNNVALPISNIDAATRDLITFMDEDSEKGSEAVRRIPWIGEMYFWYMGEGARKIDEGVYDE